MSMPMTANPGQPSEPLPWPQGLGHPEKDGSQEILLFGWTCLGGNMTPYGPTSGSLSLANEE